MSDPHPLLLAALLISLGCGNPYDVVQPPGGDDDDGEADDDDDSEADDDDTHPGDDDTHPGDDDTGPQQGFPGSCPGQPNQPSPASIADPEPWLAFGSRGGHRGSPLVLDADGDGIPDIVSSENQQVTVYDLEGDTVWYGEVANRAYAGAVLANVDGQPGNEVVAADGAGGIHVWEAHGPPLAGWPVQLEGQAEIRTVAAVDLDGDGADEIVVMGAVTPHAAPATMYVFEGDGSVAAGWPHYDTADPVTALACEDCGGYNQNVAVGDLEGDGTLDLVFTGDFNAINVFDAQGNARDAHGSFDNCAEGLQHHWGEIRAGVPYDSEHSVICASFDQELQFAYSPPLIADLEHDGMAEVIVVAGLADPADPDVFEGSALAVYQPTRQVRFGPYPRAEGSLAPGEGDWYWPGPTAVAANFTGNPELEILAVHLDGSARLYDTTGAELYAWIWSSEPGCVATEPLIADLDGDLVPEAILVATCPDESASTLTVLGGEGNLRLTYELDFQTVATPLLTDLDGDGGLEIVFANMDSFQTIRIYHWPGTDDSCVIWPQGRGGDGHLGWLR